ncbi:MAG: anti-sigma factor domain-containing protein [Phycisphaerales bacterium]
MSRSPDPNRLLELLADQATSDLSAQDDRELRQLLAGATDDSMEHAAAATAAAFAAPDSQPIPDSLRRKLITAATTHGDSRVPVPRGSDVAGRIGTRTWVKWAGWAAAAGIALGALWPRGAAVTPIRSQYQQMASAAGVAHAQWADWDSPEQAGVTGEVIWDESRQRGFMKFVGLKPNDPRAEQYQLWIIDERGLADSTGQSARISGGVFDAQSGETLVPIAPALAVRGAAAFAITIEKPGGTWVSDMKRRVVIAPVKKG